VKCTGHFLDTASEPVNNKKFSDFNLVVKECYTRCIITADRPDNGEETWCDLWYSDNNDNAITQKCMSVYYNHQSI